MSLVCKMSCAIQTDLSLCKSGEGRLMGEDPLWSKGLSEDFVLDTGVPYRRAARPRVLLVESWPKQRFDPNKPARVSAFSSWIMAIATTAEEIEVLVERSLEILGKRIHA